MSGMLSHYDALLLCVFLSRWAMEIYKYYHTWSVQKSILLIL